MGRVRSKFAASYKLRECGILKRVVLPRRLSRLRAIQLAMMKSRDGAKMKCFYYDARTGQASYL